MRFLLQMLGVLILQQIAAPGRPFIDHTHRSEVFGGPRNYRIVLPPDYRSSGKSYPVIYFFHGHSDRYTLEHYDGGTDFIPKILDYVARHEVIVVSVDGYVAEDYTGFYGGSPWDLRKEGGSHDFGPYFEELVGHIDSTYRTLTGRRHRATSGLSMGGFMSLWLSARYPHLVGSASAFNPGPEFYAGDAGRRILWRPKDHVSNHTHTMVRLIRASGDYISQYHEETRAAYAAAEKVSFEYRVDEYHRHWITSLAETFDFHMRAFANTTLDNAPVLWSYANPYKKFAAWGYEAESEFGETGITYLQDVSQNGLRIFTRLWAPDGPPAAGRRITVRTAPLYEAKRAYTVLDHHLATGVTARYKAVTDEEGRLTLTVDGNGHQISFVGPGTGGQPPVLLPLTQRDALMLPPAKDLSLPIRVYNPRGEAMTDVTVRLSSEYPTVQLLSAAAKAIRIEPGAYVDLSDRFRIRLTAGAGYLAPARLDLAFVYDGWHEATEPVLVRVVPEILPAPDEVVVMDGRTRAFRVFHQSGNQGGGASIENVVTEGKGNGNGILEPGEEATLWVRVSQGLDPFDKNNWYRCRAYFDSPWLREVSLLENPKQREWTSAMERSSLIRLSEKAPGGTTIPVLLDNESWSFHYTPDVRFGPERLYQAFQFHTHHLHRYELKVP